MSRYLSPTVILPDETHLNDFVVEVTGTTVSYYPFTGEQHTTLYVPDGILLSHRDDLDGKTFTLNLLSWAMGDAGEAMYAYALSPCPSCMGDRYVLARL